MVKVDMELISVGEHQLQEKTLKTLETYVNRVKGEHIRESQDGFDKIREYFREEVEIRDKETKKMETKLQRAFAFIKNSFGDGQELLLFIKMCIRDSQFSHRQVRFWISVPLLGL